MTFRAEGIEPVGSATETVAINRSEWVDAEGTTYVLLPGDLLDPSMPGHDELVAKGEVMSRAAFEAIEDEDRLKRINGLRKRIAELQAAIDALVAEDEAIIAARSRR